MKKILALSLLYAPAAFARNLDVYPMPNPPGLVNHGQLQTLPLASDPYEKYNRFMFRINDNIDQALFRPVARGYTKVVPKPARAGVTNFFNNLRDLNSAASNFLRLDITRGSTDLVRFGLNSTFGFGGLINVADATKMPNNKSTLGDTFATWGWKNSHYLVYPLFGPSTVRDAVGDTVSSAYAPQNYLLRHASSGWYYGASALQLADKRAQLLPLTDSLDEAALDPYAYTRDAFMSMRQAQISGNQFQAAPTENIDDLVTPENIEPENANSDAASASAAPQTDCPKKHCPQSALPAPEAASESATERTAPETAPDTPDTPSAQ